jgi:HlyD family secretion protein
MKKALFISGFVILCAVVLVVLVSGRSSAKESGYQFAEVTRGDIENVVSSTGTLNPVSTVEVGTQVSGTLDKIFVDFNNKVSKGQILAVLDTTILSAAVRDAQAGIIRSQAQYDQGQSDYARAQQLFEKEMISEYDLATAKTTAETARAALMSAEITLNRAKTNLEYAVIRSPINGIVISRNVEEGQTVAASLSAPTLFIIAENLENMEIQAMVDESDIGQLKPGQQARFTVEAYPDEEFTGIVKQIRLQPTTVQNVVNYTVIVSADNKSGLLLPGMTATIDFIVEQSKDVLMIPNSALRYQPSAEMLQQFRENMEKRRANLPDSVKARFAERHAGADSTSTSTGGRMAGQYGGNMSRLWYLDDKNQLSMALVKTGATDGRNTEIVQGRNIKEGMMVINSNGESSSSSRQNEGGPPHMMRRMF